MCVGVGSGWGLGDILFFICVLDTKKHMKANRERTDKTVSTAGSDALRANYSKSYVNETALKIQGETEREIILKIIVNNL